MRFNNYYDDNLLLNEENQKLLTQNDDQGAYDVEIDDTALQHLEMKSKSPELSTSAVNPTIVHNATVNLITCSQKTYTPNVFPNVEYHFRKVLYLFLQKILKFKS